MSELSMCRGCYCMTTTNSVGFCGKCGANKAGDANDWQPSIFTSAPQSAEGEAAPTHNWNFPADLLEAAWGIIANANEGNWDKATPEWKAAAEVWRDAYHKALPSADSQASAEATAAPEYDEFGAEISEPQQPKTDELRERVSRILEGYRHNPTMVAWEYDMLSLIRTERVSELELLSKQIIEAKHFTGAQLYDYVAARIAELKGENQ